MALSQGGGGVWPVARDDTGAQWLCCPTARAGAPDLDLPFPGVKFLGSTWPSLCLLLASPQKSGTDRFPGTPDLGPIPSPAALLLQDFGLADLVHL